MLEGLNIEPPKVSSVIKKFIEKRVNGSGLNGGIIGLSGGLDSTVTLFLTVAAIGKSNVLGVSLPYQESAQRSIDDAQLAAESVGVELETIDISPISDAYLRKQSNVDKLRKGNFLARIRMSILYDLSAKYSKMVIGTGNKSEKLLGYMTLWGDMACGIAPLGDLYKTQEYKLARYLETPPKIINKEPSADLWPGQTDEKELGFDYETADQVLYYLIEEGLQVGKIVRRGFDKEIVEKIKTLYENTDFKRRLPSFPKIQ